MRIPWLSFPQGVSGNLGGNELDGIFPQGENHETLDAGQAVTGADIGCWGGDFFFLVTPAAP
jgi:hypothetical protein